MVTVKEGRVNFDAGNGAGSDAETDDDPVEGLGVVTTGFPAVVPGASEDEAGFILDWGFGVEEVGCVGEPFVGAGEDLPAKGRGCEV